MPSALPFREALSAVIGKWLLPTNLNSEQLSMIEADILERSLFSACTVYADYLQDIRRLISRMADGTIDQATARQELRDKLSQLDYSPEPGKQGGIQDLSSEQRLNLVIETNTEMAQNYGTWLQGQDPEVLDQWPAQELIRWEDRREKRDWLSRWHSAGGQVFPGMGPDTPGRLVALKNSPVWESISAFGLPYPPFDFNSGVGVRDVTRSDSVRLGLIDENTRIQPKTQHFNHKLEATTRIDPVMKDAILDALGPGFSFEGDQLIA